MRSRARELRSGDLAVLVRSAPLRILLRKRRRDLAALLLITVKPTPPSVVPCGGDNVFCATRTRACLRIRRQIPMAGRFASRCRITRGIPHSITSPCAPILHPHGKLREDPLRLGPCPDPWGIVRFRAHLHCKGCRGTRNTTEASKRSDRTTPAGEKIACAAASALRDRSVLSCKTLQPQLPS